jgi:hypothetical protein
MTMTFYIRLPRHLRAELERRGDLAGGGAADLIRRDLERYYQLLAREERALAPRLSEAEWNLLRDALNGVMLDDASWRFLAEEVADAIADGDLAAKWGVDGPALVARLRALTPAQTLVVVDAVERFWHDQAAAPAADPAG